MSREIHAVQLTVEKVTTYPTDAKAREVAEQMKDVIENRFKNVTVEISIWTLTV